MNIDFFRIPVIEGEQEAERLNQLLNSVRVLSVDREFVADSINSFWSICVQYQSPNQRQQALGRKPSIDYRDVLSPEDFTIFARLRELRKRIAAEEAIPPYAVFTNEQLSQMVLRKVSVVPAMREIDGIGEARVSKYGEQFIAELDKVRASDNGIA